MKEGVPVQGEKVTGKPVGFVGEPWGKVRESEKTIEKIRYPPHLNPPPIRIPEYLSFKISKFTW